MSALKKMVLLLTAVAVSVPLWAKVELEYFYADDGTLTGRAVNGVRQNFVYDKRGQLLAVKDARGNDIERYVYDPAGNILSKTVGGVTTKYSYDKANQLLTSTRNGKVTKYEYDAAGRLIREGDKVYFYGYQDKILTVTVNGKKKLTFDYHMDGQLASASGNGKSEEFLWDGLALIKRGNTRYVNEPYVTGGNPVIAGNDVMFNDMLGSTVAINDKAVGMTSFGETVDSKAMYTGKPYVDGLGYAFLFRNYRTDLGKWQTADPLGYPDGWNQMAYCNNSAIENVDFLGAWLEAAHHSINARWLESNSDFIPSGTSFKWGDNCSFNIVGIFNAASDWTDSSPNQADDKAYMHAMRSENESSQEAASRYNNYLNQLKNSAKYTSDLARKAYMDGNFSAATSWMNSALNFLGCLVHTYVDSLSPSHSGFQHFTYWSSPAHLYNERDSVYQSMAMNITHSLNISYGNLLKYVLKQPE